MKSIKMFLEIELFKIKSKIINNIEIKMELKS